MGKKFGILFESYLYLIYYFVYSSNVRSDAIVEDKKPTLKQPIPSRTNQKKKALDAPRCFASLENTSRVPLPITVRNIRKKTGKTKINKRSASSQANGSSDVVETGEKFGRDLWSEKSSNKIVETEENQWFHIDLKRHHLRKTTFVAPKITLDKRNRVKPIENPVGGSSYNPSDTDFKLLMDMTVEREKGIIKKEEKYANSLKKVYAKVSKNQIKRWRKEEFSQGFPNANGEFEKNEPEEDAITIDTIPVVNKKKDLRKRRKQTEEKLKRAKSKLTAIEIAKMKDLKK